MSKTITGSRAVVRVNGNIVGIFETCTFNRSYGTEAIHLLGRYSPSEIAYTSAEAVTLSCSGFRVAGNGVHVLPAVPKVQDLLSFEPFEVTVTDRQTGDVILTAHNCSPNGDNGNHNARATSRVTVNYIGTIMDDESGTQSESQGATDLP
jgi:hypothetical protein